VAQALKNEMLRGQEEEKISTHNFSIAQRVATQALKNEMLRKNGKRARDDDEEQGEEVEKFENGSAVGHHTKKSFNKTQKSLPGGFKGNKKFGAGGGGGGEKKSSKSGGGFGGGKSFKGR